MTVLRAVGAPLFIVGGGSLVLMSLAGAAPSLWYFVCFCALPVVGVVWLWQPPRAAALSIGPLISVAALLHYVSGMWTFSRIWAGSVVVGLATALVLVVAALRGSSHWRLPVALSLAFVTCAFATDRLFTNKVTVRTYQMYVAVNGHAPWGDVGPEWPDGSAPVVLYRRVGNSYCYDAFKSEELRQRLAPKDGHTVTVEYNLFSDFGRQRSYNVRSVDGVLPANRGRVVRDFERFGGEILGNSDIPSSGVDNCR
ncbi:MAG: hypothetical protein ABSE40_15060 [Candidatus Sulfotelmatobacter sp.]